MGDEGANNASAHEHAPVSRDDVYVDVGAWMQARDTVDEHAQIRNVHDVQLPPRAQSHATEGLEAVRCPPRCTAPLAPIGIDLVRCDCRFRRDGPRCPITRYWNRRHSTNAR